MRVAAFTASKNCASARFRVRQLVPVLAQHDVAAHEFVAPIWKHYDPGTQNRAVLMGIRYARPLALLPSIAASYAFDLAWIQREFIWGQDSLERLVKHPRLFDVDDAIWLQRDCSERNIASLAKRMDVVIAGNGIIASWFKQFTPDVRIVHTAVDTSRYTPPGERKPRGIYEVVWTGQQATLHHLQTVERVLAEFMRRHQDVQLTVVTDIPPKLDLLPSARVKYVKWSPDIEVEAVRYADVGLMPLADDPQAHAKCSFKMLQYMACAMPVVVSPYGLNADVLAMGDLGFGASDDDAWLGALEALYQDRERAARMGEAGRKVATERFSHRVIAEQLATIFRDVAAARAPSRVRYRTQD